MALIINEAALMNRKAELASASLGCQPFTEPTGFHWAGKQLHRFEQGPGEEGDWESHRHICAQPVQTSQAPLCFCRGVAVTSGKSCEKCLWHLTCPPSLAVRTNLFALTTLQTAGAGLCVLAQALPPSAAPLRLPVTALEQEQMGKGLCCCCFPT